jgi:hypothetical protein
MQTKFNFYEDPGHGWAKVPVSVLKKLGIDQKISWYSYIKGENAYLEEDCDLGLLFDGFKEIGIVPTFKTFHTDRSSKIRSYNHYKVTA